MTRTIRISVEAANLAKAKAASAGMKLYAFMEMAVRHFDIRVNQRRDRTPRRKAG